MLIFYFFLLLNAEIPDQYIDLANRAILQSKNKNPKSEKYESLKPGDYIFNQYKFTLTRTCSSPLTSDIKGYSIDNITDNIFIAIIKPKTFQLQNFSFFVPNNNQIYDMSNIIASDKKVLIYKAKKLTIFDVFTNFEYHQQTTKKLNSIFWNTTKNEPITTEIPENEGINLGCGGFGSFFADLKTTFKSKSDLLIQASLEIDLELALLAKLKETYSMNTIKSVISSIEIPISEFSNNFNFLGIEFDFGVNFMFETSIEKLKLIIPHDMRIFNNQKYIGKKTITITNFHVIDSPWQITRIHHSYLNSSLKTFEYDNDDNLTAQILTVFNLALVVKFNFLDLQSTLNVGLKIPIDLMMESNSRKCVYPYATLDFDISVSMYYYFDGIYLNIKSKRVKLIESSSSEVKLFSPDHSKSCSFSSGQVVERNSKVVQKNYTKSYIVETDYFYWNISNPNLVQLVIEANEINDTKPKAIKIYPFQAFNANQTNPTRLHSFFIIEKIAAPIINFFFKNQLVKLVVLLKKKKKWYGKTKRIYSNYYYHVESYSYPYIVETNDSWPTSTSLVPMMNHTDFELNGHSTIWLSPRIYPEIVYECENIPVVLTQIPNDDQKRAIISLNKDGNSWIDETATFFVESMTDDQYMSTGTYQNDKKQSHFEISFGYLTAAYVGSTLNLNITLELNINNQIIQQQIGHFAITFSDGKSYKGEILDKYRMKFYIPPNCTPSLIFVGRFTSNDLVYGTSGVATESHIRQTKYFELNVNGFFQFCANFEPIIDPLISIKSSIQSDCGVLATVVDENLKYINSAFTVKFEINQTYKVINITSSKYPLKDCYLFLQNNQFTPITPNATKISDSIYAIYISKDYLSLPIRRTIGETKECLSFNYLIAQVNNIENMNINVDGEVLNFTRNMTAKAFIVPLIHGDYYIYINRQNDFIYYTMRIDNDNEILAIYSELCDEEIYKLFNSYVILSKDELSTTFNSTAIESSLKDRCTEYFVTVICDSDDAKSIRHGSRVQDLIDGKTVFSFYENENKILEFVAVCKDDSGAMCELSFKPKTGIYHLLHFPSCDGINISGRGMEYAIIPAYQNETLGYYKHYRGPIHHIRSYEELTDIIVLAKDFYPLGYQKPSLQDLESSKKDYDDDYVSAHPYRSFCIYDFDGNNIPFSTKLVSNHLDSFMKSINARSDYSILDYNITRNGCIQVNLDIIQNDKMTSFEPNIVDLNVSSISIDLTTSIQVPTDSPVNKPTDSPINKPTDFPVNKPTDWPINKPTDSPINKPTDSPVNKPTNDPIDQPTNNPNNKPNDDPNYQPDDPLISKPADIPIINPTNQPTNDPINKPSDRPNRIPSNETIELSKINSYSTIDTSDIKITEIACPKSTLIFIHKMKGHIVSLYNSNDEFIASINENDQHKIINFGESNGILAIERISRNVEEFSYSYIILDKASMDENSPKCDDIYISSNSVSSFTIKSSESTFRNFDYSLSKSNNFCLWFTFPFYSSVNSIVNLPHSQVLIVDDAKISTHAAELDVKGYNLLYKLLNTSKGNIHENAIFNCMPEDPNDLSSFVSYEKVNGFYHINASNGILIPFMYEKNSTEIIRDDNTNEKTHKKFYIIVGVATFVAVAIVIALTIVIIILVKKNKPYGIENKDYDPQESQGDDSNETNTYNDNETTKYDYSETTRHYSEETSMHDSKETSLHDPKETSLHDPKETSLHDPKETSPYDPKETSLHDPKDITSSGSSVTKSTSNW